MTDIKKTTEHNADKDNTKKLRTDAFKIIDDAIHEVLPDIAVIEALKNKNFSGKQIFVVAIGKAAWTMSKAASTVLGSSFKKGIIITKYDHAKEAIEGFDIVEAGHPIPDSNSILGATKALDLAHSLNEDDQLLFLISGGGSALFESPLENISLEDIMDITDQLLRSGADIVEINTVRKHLSDVKGGRFAKHCKAPIYAIVLSDVIGDRLDSIASGPAYPDSTTSAQALAVLEKYDITAEQRITDAIGIETPKIIDNVETVISGSVRSLCAAASRSAERLGYQPFILTSSLDCEAREAGKLMASLAREVMDVNSVSSLSRPCAIIAGGETIVHIKGNGDGGRNQELALSGALNIENIDDVVLFSIGSDGTDGPTDAAGGLVDGQSATRMRQAGKTPEGELDKNNSYHALMSSGDLIIIGATGTNVNDLVVVLCH